MRGRARSSRSSSSAGDTTVPAAPSHLLVGVLGRAVGLRGEIEVRVVSDDPARFAPGSQLYEAGSLRPLTVRSMRRHHERTIVSFDQVHDRASAEAMRGVELVVPVEAARTLGPGEWWDHDLIGCAVVTTDGEPVGTVGDVHHLPANDVLVVPAPTGEHLIPLVQAIVRSVDVGGRRVVVDPIPGLLGPDPDDE